MDKFRILLLHPDPQVRDELRRALSGSDFVRVVGEAVSAFEAMELIEAVSYGAVFLGFDLPGGVSGAELAQMLGQRKNRPALVFVAEDESLACKAFELEALDYLRWPCEGARMEKTLSRLRAFRSTFKEAALPQPRGWDGGDPDDEDEEGGVVKVPMAEDEEDRFLSALRQAWDFKGRSPEIEKLPITLDGKLILVPYDEIIFVEAYEDYSYVHTAQTKFLTSHRLKDLEVRLRPHRFFRVHRKFLVNLDMVTEIASLPGSNFMLRTTIKGKTRIELPVSRRRIADLKQILGL
ncbi:two component transcriptional regulator, LytTR family [Desulfovibrio sp. X2]|uniref:LytR/AlgR family response regulator transcription factor n=1 Tax=Desulfovibrio sp. X2 TaxID=941449 RepID=UPI000358C4CA|nr:LytTR family DNA-binding domain-containing protein [Desulfovibrio sp. X2]EPR43355.1 two component transcriptional regulator, LytTR family [Desulfovibrio sp. X2]